MYQIGASQDDTVRGSLSNLFRGKPSNSEEFWALKNVDLEVNQGDVLGIIGKNGAGKSTILKVLSQITHPTEGRIEINGRVASLLEVGTGFHPELTGRENIFLNGTILGMSRKEVKAKFDEIVEFSGVAKFIDTPVKHYSSGMYVRLAFAVAAHLEPEILIIDEVLAVGDAEFQKKCLGKMKDVASHGRTVLFVSHNMQAVNTLCTKGVVLDKGELVFSGPASDAIKYYQNLSFATSYHWTGDEGDDNVRLVETKLNTQSGHYHTDEEVEISIRIKVINPVPNVVAGFHLLSEYNDPLAYSISGDYNENARKLLGEGEHTFSFKIPGNTLAKGNYLARIDLGIHDVKFICQGFGDLSFSVMNRSDLGCRFPVQELRGYSSLFRPNWES